MEGNKAFILPAVAAVVLLVLLMLRGKADAPASGAEPSAGPSVSETVPKGVKAQIREALTAAGDPVLGPSVQAAVSSALQPVVDRCRSSRPASAATGVRVAVEVIAAEGIGLRVERAQVQGELPADLVGCVREGMLGSKPADIGQTGRMSTTLEFAAP